MKSCANVREEANVIGAVTVLRFCLKSSEALECQSKNIKNHETLKKQAINEKITRTSYHFYVVFQHLILKRLESKPLPNILQGGMEE